MFFYEQARLQELRNRLQVECDQHESNQKELLMAVGWEWSSDRNGWKCRNGGDNVDLDSCLWEFYAWETRQESQKSQEIVEINKRIRTPYKYYYRVPDEIQRGEHRTPAHFIRRRVQNRNHVL